MHACVCVCMKYLIAFLCICKFPVFTWSSLKQKVIFTTLTGLSQEQIQDTGCHFGLLDTNEKNFPPCPHEYLCVTGCCFGLHRNRKKGPFLTTLTGLSHDQMQDVCCHFGLLHTRGLGAGNLDHADPEICHRLSYMSLHAVLVLTNRVGGGHHHHSVTVLGLSQALIHAV